MSLNRHFFVAFLLGIATASCVANEFSYLLRIEARQPRYSFGYFYDNAQLEFFTFPDHSACLRTLVAASSTNAITSYWIEARSEMKGELCNEWGMKLGPTNLVTITAAHSLNGRNWYNYGYHTYDRYEVTSKGRFTVSSNGEYRLLLLSPLPTLAYFSSSNALYAVWPNARYIPNVLPAKPVSCWRKYAPVGLSIVAVIMLVALLLRIRIKK